MKFKEKKNQDNYNILYNIFNCFLIFIFSIYLYFLIFYDSKLLDCVMLPLVDNLDMLKWHITLVLFIYDIYNLLKIN